MSEETKPVTMRAKMKVESVHITEFGETLKMNAVAASSYDAANGGSDEDNTYALYSPTASLEIHVRNPALWGKFKPNQKFYVNFEEAAK